MYRSGAPGAPRGPPGVNRSCRRPSGLTRTGAAAAPSRDRVQEELAITRPACPARVADRKDVHRHGKPGGANREESHRQERGGAAAARLRRHPEVVCEKPPQGPLIRREVAAQLDAGIAARPRSVPSGEHDPQHLGVGKACMRHEFGEQGAQSRPPAGILAQRRKGELYAHGPIPDAPGVTPSEIPSPHAQYCHPPASASPWSGVPVTTPSNVLRRERAIRLTVAASAGAKGVSAVCTLLQVPLALHYLGTEAYGFWVTLFSIVIVLNFVDFGLGAGMQN